MSKLSNKYYAKKISKSLGGSRKDFLIIRPLSTWQKSYYNNGIFKISTFDLGWTSSGEDAEF